MRALLISMVVVLVGCGPELRISRYEVEIAAIESCERLGAASEVCEEPEAVVDRVPVVLEIVEPGEVTLFAGDPETDLDRAYFGTLRGDQLTLRRQLRQIDEAADCTFEQTSDLSLQIDETTLSGSERKLLNEAAGCNALGLETVRRTDLRWHGRAVD